MKRSILYLVPAVLLLCVAAVAQNGDSPEAHALATNDAVYVFVNVLPADGVAGFIVSRADAPVNTLNCERDEVTQKASADLQSSLQSAHQDVLDQVLQGKTLDELQKEVEDLEKTDPQAAEKRKQELQAAIEQNIKDFDDKAGKMQSDSKDTMDKYHDDYKNKVEAAVKSGPAPEDFKKLTDSPVKPITSEKDILALLGLDSADSLKALGVNSASELVTDYAQHKDEVDLLLLHFLEMNEIMGHVYEDKTVTAGNGYIYRVDLVDASGKVVRSLDAVNATAKANPPAAPTGFKAEAKAGFVELIWDKPDPAPNGWLILRADDDSTDFKQVNPGVTSSIGKTMFRDTAVRHGQKLTYQLVTVDLVGNRSTPSQNVTVTFKDIVPPAPPSGVEASLKNGQISLTWPENRDQDLAGYKVYRSNAMEGDYTLLTNTPLDTNTTEHVSDVDVPGTVHYYHVTALDAVGNESYPSHVAWVHPPDTEGPEVITGLSGKHSGPDAVILTWSDSDTADLHGYHLYRGYSKDDLKKVHTAVIPEGTNSYEDDNLRPGETYYYAVAGVDIHMNEGAKSDVIEVVAPDSVAPEHPANIAATPGDGIVTLSWPANHEPDVAAYHLYRAESENGSFSKIKETAATDTQYVDTDVRNGVQYWYFMKAVDKAGNESQASHKVYATPRDTTAPAAPSGVNAAAAETGITVSWQASAGQDIAGYLVLRAPAETAVYETLTSQPVSGTSYTDATADGQCWYKIIAVDTSGNKSPRSSAAGAAAPAQANK